MLDNLLFGGLVTRRLPIYLLVDVSESMIGEPLDAVNAGIQTLIENLWNDPHAVETAYLSIITFSGKARQVMPLREVLQVRPPPLTVGPGTGLGAAFELLATAMKRELRHTTAEAKGDYRPLIFLTTDGIPTDDWRKGLERFRNEAGKEQNVIALGCGEDVDLALLKQITPNVLFMRDVTTSGFKAFLNWVSASISVASVQVGGAGGRLPSPPGVLEVVGTVSAAAPTAPAQYIFAARCSRQGKGYLMRYRRAGDRYRAQGAFPVGEDYFSEADSARPGQAIGSDQLEGAPPCPYCGRAGWRLKADKSGLECYDRLELAGGLGQVMFVLDITGSMAGELAGVRDSIGEFVDYIAREGLSIEVGLIAFRDLEMGEPPEVLMFGSSPFTTDTAAFKMRLGVFRVNGGGGNRGESSFDALALASRQPFKAGAERILILISDEPPLLPDGDLRTIADVVARLKAGQIDQLHIVVPEKRYRYFRPLHDDIKGQFFPLPPSGRGGRGFHELLIDIGRRIVIEARIG